MQKSYLTFAFFIYKIFCQFLLFCDGGIRVHDRIIHIQHTNCVPEVHIRLLKNHHIPPGSKDGSQGSLLPNRKLLARPSEPDDPGAAPSRLLFDCVIHPYTPIHIHNSSMTSYDQCMYDEVTKHRRAVAHFIFDLQQAFFDSDAPDAESLAQAVKIPIYHIRKV